MSCAHFFPHDAATSRAALSRARVVTCRRDLHARGIIFVPVPAIDHNALAREYAQVSPQSVFFEDGEYAQYRNVLDDEAFPFGAIAASLDPALREHFGDDADFELDDAFVIHYNTGHGDTTVRKHTDPSDVTSNLCLERTEDVTGSRILFYGVRRLKSAATDVPCDCDDGGCRSSIKDDDVDDDDSRRRRETDKLTAAPDDDEEEEEEEVFCVDTRPGFAMLHYGDHPHETTPLERGRRTNCVMTYRFKPKEEAEVPRTSR